jgi:hypothetical protein
MYPHPEPSIEILPIAGYTLPVATFLCGRLA